VVASCRQLQEADSLQWDDSAIALLQHWLLGLRRDSLHHQQGEREMPETGERHGWTETMRIRLGRDACMELER
jgi:hypothetical protein